MNSSIHKSAIAYLAYFFCATSVYAQCPTGEIPDCNGNCAPESWVGDGYCDDGAYEWNGNLIDFNCAKFKFDGGDCEGGGGELGACILPGGDCADGAPEGECVAFGGTWMGAGVLCSEVGSCCMPDGTCFDYMIESTCQGVFYLAQLCSEIVCDATSTGGCILPDGSCVDETTEEECDGMDGDWQELLDCIETTGACCHEEFDGTSSCFETYEDWCQMSGDNWQGYGTTCAETECPDPNSEEGACCVGMGDGTYLCEEMILEYCQQFSDFRWMGSGSTCSETDCTIFETTGACCHEEFDGTSSCFETYQDFCQMSGDNWQGYGTTCAETECPDPGFDAGACCVGMGDGTYLCEEMILEYCQQFSDFRWMGSGSTCSETDCTIFEIGACCYDNMSACVNETEDYCFVSLEGVWMGAGTDCAELNCSTAYDVGACCFGNNFESCIETFEYQCGGTFEGLWQGAGTSCSSIDCTELGGCDLPDGSCENVTENECDVLGGSWMGADMFCPELGACCWGDDWVFCNDNIQEILCVSWPNGSWQGAGTNCATTECLPFGACCFGENWEFCEQENEQLCTVYGSWQGAGTLCSVINCSKLGACLLPDETCVDGTTEDECDAYGGSWMGVGITCDELGACCWPDGSCSNTTVGVCEGVGFVFHQGQRCSDVFCDLPPGPAACCLPDFSCIDMEDTTDWDVFCNQLYNGTFIPGNTCAEIDCELGACLLPDGTCVDGTTEDECDAYGGSWMGVGITCDELGACCWPDGSCSYTTVGVCEGVGFVFYPGMICSDVDCFPQPSPAACCLPNHSCIDMEDTPEYEVLCSQSYSGTFIPGNTCAEIDCELGACLLPDGTCVDGTTEDECDAFGGSWMGIAALCDELGACCFGDHWEQCVYADLLECAEVWGGIWKGEGTQCSTVVCEWRAACCIQSSTCINTTESLCQAFNGLWFEGVTCSVFPCHNLGACIFADGSCVDTITDDECTTKGGYHYYPQTLCSELGACCASENLEICEVMPLVVCEWFNGFWYGFETNCTVVNCPPCLEDVTGDGVVDVSDILEVIGNWGSCEGCNADVNGDGTVGVNDLLAIVGAWGVCP